MPLPPSTEFTQLSSSDSSAHKLGGLLPCACALSQAARGWFNPCLSAIDEPLSQPNLEVFPELSRIEKQGVSQVVWTVLGWNSVNNDAVFCKMCRHFPSRVDGPFVTEGFVDWKHPRQACDTRRAIPTPFHWTSFKSTELQAGNEP